MSAPTPRFAHDLFISYAHADDHDGWVSALVEAIQSEHARFTTTPLEVFFDTAEIRTMDDWEHRIYRGLRHAKVMLAVLSPNYFASPYCRKEWERYLDQELDRAMPGEAIAPLYTITVPGFEGRADDALERWRADLDHRQYLDLRPWRPEGPEALRREEARRKLAKLDQDVDIKLRKAERVVESPSTVPPHNRTFVGRVDELRELREQLALGRIGAIAAVHGIGGIGKSALAYEYAHAFADEYPGGRFLVPCDGVTDLRVPIVNLAEYRGVVLTDDEKKDLGAAFARVRAAFERGPRTLLVLDNLDDPSLLTPIKVAHHLPATDTVHVLATTRLGPDQLPGLTCLPLDALPEPDALRLLEKYRPFDGDDDEWKAAVSIVDRLAGHPLALEVVGVYLWQTPSVTYAGYAARLEREGLEAHLATAGDDRVALGRHQVKLLTALLGPTLERLSPSEWLALSHAALLPPDRIALPWLNALVGRHLPAAVAAPGPGYPDPWLDLLRRLHGLRLLVRGKDDHLARMHRLVQDVVAARLGPDRAAEQRRALIEHALSRGQFLREGWVDRSHRWELDPVRDFALRLMDSDQAEAGCELANWVHGPLHRLGRYGEQRSLLLRAIDVGEKVFEPDHPILVASYSNLAPVEQALGNPIEARRLVELAIDIQKKALGPDHPDFAASYSILATIEKDLGNPAKARRLLKQAVDIGEKTLAPDHPALAVSYSNLALVERELGSPAEARRLLELAIDIQKKALGPDHPDLIHGYSNLALVEEDQGNSAEARRLLKQAVDIGEKTLDPDHPDLALVYSNLAVIEQSLGNLAEARRRLKQAIEINEKAFDPDHPTLATSYSNLALVEEDQGNSAEARQWMKQAVDILEKAFEPDHPKLALGYSNLAAVEQALGNLPEARRLLELAIQIEKKALGPDHPKLAASYSNLAVVERNLRNPTKARQLLKQAIGIQKKAFGPDHPDLATIYSNLALVEGDQGYVTEARRLLKVAIDIQKKALEPDHPDLALQYFNLAHAERNLRNLPEARKLMRRAHQIWLSRLGAEHPHTRLAAEWLAKLGRGAR